MNLYQGDSGDFYFGDRPDDEGSKYVGHDDSANYVGLMSAQQANKTNIQLAKDNNDFNMRMWEMNNAYNDPSKQVERYLAAGINPSAAIGNISSGNSSSPVQGSMANAVAGTYDPTAKWQKFGSIMSSVLGGLTTLKDAFSQGVDIKRLANETKTANANTALTDAQTFAQLFDNSKKKESWDANLANINASTEQILAQTKLSQSQREEIIKNLGWIDSLNGAQMAKLRSEVGKTDAETHGIWDENKVKALRGRLADNGINPDSSGLDKFLDILVNDPSSIGSVFNGIFDGLTKSFGDITDHVGNKISKKVDEILNNIPSFLPNFFTSHKNPGYTVGHDKGGFRWE